MKRTFTAILAAFMMLSCASCATRNTYPYSGTAATPVDPANPVLVNPGPYTNPGSPAGTVSGLNR